MKNKLYILIAALLCMVACKDTSIDDSYIFALAEGTQTSVSVQNSSTTKSITFDAPLEWNAEAIDIESGATAQWINITPNSGNAAQGNTIDIEFTENSSTDIRNAKVSIECGETTISVLFKQLPADAEAITLTSDAELTTNAKYDYNNPLTLDFNASNSWVITVLDEYDSDPAWLTIEKYNGTEGEYSLELMLADNNTYTNRSATITIESNGETATTTLTQNATALHTIEWETINVSAGNMTFEIDPGDYTGSYFIVPYGTEYYNTYDYTQEKMMELLIEAYINQGYDLSQVNGYSVFQGKQTIDMSVGYWLTAETSYNVLLAGINENCEICSNVLMEIIVTDAITEVTDLTFEYSAEDIWLDYATVSTTPSRNGVKYFTGVTMAWLLDYNDESAWFESDTEFMEYMVGEAGLYKDFYIYDAPQTSKWTGLSGDDEYITYTFAVDGNLAISGLDYGTFCTFDGMMDLYGYTIDYAIAGSNLETSDVLVDMYPEDYTGIYYLGTYPKDKYDGDAEKMARIFIEYEQKYLTGTTEFTTVDNVNFFKGPREDFGIKTAWPGLSNNTEYVVFLFGINPDSTVPTDITTFEVTLGADYNKAPMSISAGYRNMDELINFAQSKNNGETLINNILKRSITAPEFTHTKSQFPIRNTDILLQ